MNLKAETLAAAFWTTLKGVWTNLLSFVTFIWLAKILGPGEYGAFVLAVAGLDLARVVAGAGINEALVRRLELDDDTCSTAFWASILIATAVSSLLLLVSHPYADALGSARIWPLLDALALLIPISALARVHSARMTHGFGHKALAALNAAAAVVAAIAALVAAYLGAGAWTLVIQSAVLELVPAAGVWFVHSWRPKLRFSVARLRELLSFGSGILTTQAAWALLARLPDYFIGRTLGLEAVGAFRVAFRMIDMVGQTFMAPIGSVAIVALSKLQSDESAFARAYTRMAGLLALAGAPVIIGFGAVAHLAVPLLFGSRWSASVHVAQIIAASALPFILNYLFSPALAAKGRSGIIMTFALCQLATTFLAVWLSAPLGLLAVTGAYVARGYITLALAQWLLARHAQVGALPVLKAVTPPFLASGLMAVVVLFIDSTLGPNIAAPALRLSAAITVGGIVYGAALLILARNTLSSHLSSLAPAVRQFIGAR